MTRRIPPSLGRCGQIQNQSIGGGARKMDTHFKLNPQTSNQLTPVLMRLGGECSRASTTSQLASQSLQIFDTPTRIPSSRMNTNIIQTRWCGGFVTLATSSSARFLGWSLKDLVAPTARERKCWLVLTTWQLFDLIPPRNGTQQKMDSSDQRM